MDIFLYVLYFLIALAVISTDIAKKLFNNAGLSYFVLFLANNTLLFLSVTDNLMSKQGLNFAPAGYIAFSLLLVYSWIRIQLVPCKTDTDIPVAVKIVYQGRRLLLLSVWLITIQLLVVFSYGIISGYVPIASDSFRYNNIIAFSLSLLTFLNGWFRVFFFSLRLRIVRRILVSIFIWVPIVNVFVILYISRIAFNEYDHACNKAFNESMRRESFVCETKYPLLMLHGVGFRDFKYLNYWGRIPKHLIKNGATVYYGHQEALGTIEGNGYLVKDKILEIIKQTDCGKVNIIAHSKGGLDARYTITALGMDEFVASLTTISTPHRGSALADFGNKHLSDGMYRSVANLFDKYFRKIGDKNPDFYTAMHQFTKEYAEKFNDETPDIEGIYYQSYMSLMKNCLSHSLLSVPYLIMCLHNKQNDGLVSLESARWGEFREVYTNRRRRGISHGDMIDLTRGNYKSFDVIETYISIVSDLKNKGF